MPTVQINRKKLKQQIAGLEYLIKHDTNEKDREIHQRALKRLKEEAKC